MFGDLGKMIKLAAEMKSRIPAVQAKLAAGRFEADAGGVVSAVVDGKGILLDLRIDQRVFEGRDAAMLKDLVKTAVSAAQDQATQAAADAMKELTGGMGLPPGFGDILG